MIVTRSRIEQNIATLRGGGVWTYGTVIVEAQSSISGNKAGVDAGGIWLGAGGTLDLSGGSAVCENIAQRNGAGIFATSSTINVSRMSSICNNTAVGGAGGGMWIGDTSTAYLDSALISENKAHSGGGISIESTGTIFVTGNSRVTSNVASEVGGGIAARLASRVVVHAPTQVDMNMAEKGAGLYADLGSKIELYAGVRIRANRAITGAGVTVSGSGARLLVAGGGCRYVEGIFDWPDFTYKAENARVFIARSTNDTSPETTVREHQDDHGELMQVEPVFGTKVEFSFCLVPGQYKLWSFSKDSLGWGAGALTLRLPDGSEFKTSCTQGDFSTETVFEISEDASSLVSSAEVTTISENHADQSGGGVAILSQATAVLWDAAIFNCTAVGDGGGVYADEQASLSLFSSRVDGCNAQQGRGGALYAGSLALVEWKDSNVSSSSASMGGAWYLDGVAASKFRGARVFECTATTKGGGAYFDHASDNTVETSSFVGNAAPNAAALFTENSEVTLSDNAFLFNVADFDGAAIMSTGSASDVTLADWSECRSPVTVDIDWRETGVKCSTRNSRSDVTCDGWGSTLTCAEVIYQFTDTSADESAWDAGGWADVTNGWWGNSAACHGCACNGGIEMTRYVQLTRVSDGHEATALAWANGFSRTVVCDFAPGDTLRVEGIDQFSTSWWDGSFSLYASETVLAEHVKVNRSSTELTITLPGSGDAEANKFEGNVATAGGGGALFWSDTAPAGIVQAMNSSSLNTALYGAGVATPAVSMRLFDLSRNSSSNGNSSGIQGSSSTDAVNSFSSSYTAVSGYSMVEPVSVELIDRW